MNGDGKFSRLIGVLLLFSGLQSWAGIYEGLEPGRHSKTDADIRLGTPIREISPGKQYDYDPKGKGQRISISYRPGDQVIDSIQLEPGGDYHRDDYSDWFGLGEATVAEIDNDGNWVEYHLIQGISLHFDGPHAQSPVAYFRHFDREAFMGSGDQPEGTASGAGRSTAASSTGSCGDISGLWRWATGAIVECFGDGVCKSSDGYSGPWQCLVVSGEVEIQWARPGQMTPYIDTLRLSEDGWEIRGHTQSGHGTGGQRPEFAGGQPRPGCDAILGSWRWTGGKVVECREDGSCSITGNHTGRWRCIKDSGRFEIRWSRPGREDEFIDTFLVSPLGGYLGGTNQYGVAMGAVRQ